MNQRTHAWMAVRAVALLEDVGSAPDLVRILKPNVRSTAIGAWIPDMQDSKKGSGDIDNHIMKMKPYNGSQASRYIVSKQELIGRLGSKRLVKQFLGQDSTLSGAWWARSYKAEPTPGEHLANRGMALRTMLIDLLILGDPTVATLVPGTVAFARNLHPDARTREEQVSTYFFMLSHFVADSCMPCHCDARNLAAYKNGLHKELEARWSRKVGTYFDKKKLLQLQASDDEILAIAKKVDRKFGITFPQAIPRLKAKDVWSELMNVCRGSFAISNVMAPENQYPFGSRKKAPLKRLSESREGKLLFKKLDRVIIHDAITNIAIVWKDVWDTF